MKVGITGGIGSGKSTVCRLFAQRGIPVYDSDREAKRLMTNEPLRSLIEAQFGAESFAGDALNREYLAARLFTDSEARRALNALVHPVVMSDFAAWAERQSADYVVLESAILFDAGLEQSVDVTLAVLAPMELRVERTCRRDACEPDAVRRRISAQMSDDELCDKADFTLVNIREEDLEPAVKELDYRFRYEYKRF